MILELETASSISHSVDNCLGNSLPTCRCGFNTVSCPSRESTTDSSVVHSVVSCCCFWTELFRLHQLHSHIRPLWLQGLHYPSPSTAVSNDRKVAASPTLLPGRPANWLFQKRILIANHNRQEGKNRKQSDWLGREVMTSIPGRDMISVSTTLLRPILGYTQTLTLWSTRVYYPGVK